MRSRGLLFLPWLALVACESSSPPSPPRVAATAPCPTVAPITPLPCTAPAAPKPEEAFAAVSSRFLAGYLARAPVTATLLGEHKYDALWDDLSTGGEAELRSFLAGVRDALGPIPRDALSDASRVDARILESQIARILFALDELKAAENNPVSYTSILGDGIDPLLTREFGPLPDRMKSLEARLLGVPVLVAIARTRLKNPPRIHTETAIDQTRGLIALCEHGMADSFAKVPEMRPGLEAAAKIAVTALKELRGFFEKELLPRSNGSFRLGRPRFEKTLRFQVGDDVDIDRLESDARAGMETTLDQMVETAKELWPTLMTGPAPSTAGAPPIPPSTTRDEKRGLVRRVLAKLADEATEPKTILADATKLLEDATRFVQDHALVSLASDPCRVIEMPEYKRGVSIAYCESSGPLEKRQETFYAISPAPASWPAKRAASFYREYNKSMLADLTVHEAMPGHYLQAMHGNAFHSNVRTVFEDGAYVEGWATYGEWLMAKYGFGGPKARMQRLKMLVRVSANVVLDHEIHAGTMEEKDALSLMTDQAFQEEGEAVAKWTRARLTSGQLSTYFYGYREFMKLRDVAERAPDFRERSFNDRVLAYGAPPMRELAWLLARPAAPMASP